MPEIFLKNKKITQFVTSIAWSGDYQQAARKLELSIAVSYLDINHPVISISLGDMVKMFDDDGSELFRGYVFSKEKSNTSNEMSFTVYDGLIYLLKSKGTYNFKKLTPEQITA
ncbi:MAG TPA: hypothetical protein VHT34_14015, partial [Clostridia bacterium]|nr:hypothetical protein [Clostridia bacterium]